MELGEEIQKEYLLLKNYRDLGRITRGVLLNMDFDAIERILADNWFIKIVEGEKEEAKRKFLAAVQIDIISKIMLYIEDIAVIAESRLKEKNYYNLLDKNVQTEDVGAIVGNFFNKLDSLTDEEICKITSYLIPEKTNYDDEKKKILKKYVKNNVEGQKKILKIIGEFGKDHHAIFRRYKHAGFPFTPGIEFDKSSSEMRKKFDFYSLISLGEDPIKNIKIIPFSKDVLESYKIVIVAIQKFSEELITYRLASIERGLDGIISPDLLGGEEFSDLELKMINELLKYQKNLPITASKANVNINVKFPTDLPNWYRNLNKFLEYTQEQKLQGEKLQQQLDSVTNKKNSL